MLPVNKNDIIETEIDGIGYGGEGIAHINGYTVFIRYALPGEKVRALVILAKPTFAVGKLQSVLRASPDRAEPFCPVYYKCGGCALQHMTYAAQLEFKKRAIAETFYKTSKIIIDADEIIPSPRIRNYRNKMSLPVRGNIPEIGFFAEGTHRVVPIDECPIQFEDNGKLIKAFKKYLSDNSISGYNETTHEGAVRHLIARKLGDFITVTAVINGNKVNEIRAFNSELKSLYGKNYAYYANINTSVTNRILGDKSELIGGGLVPVNIDGLKISVHPHSFFQVNDKVRQMLYKEIASEVNSEKVIDAYSGAGVLSTILAKSAESVTAIEIESKAVESARTLVKSNGIENVRLICGDCATELPKVLEECKNADFTVVLDPPRSGCDKRVLDAVIKSAPKKIIYVSCNPATLSRDFALLSPRYEITRLTPFDMFPQTPNVETLVVLAKK